MFPAFQLNETELLAFALILIRVSVFVVTWPVFSVYSVPSQAKILFSLILAMLMYPTVVRTGLDAASLSNEIVWLAGREVLIGISMGFMSRLFFFTMSMGGNLVATYIGVASAQQYNPAMNSQTTVVEQYYLTAATLLFLAVNGHHMFLEGLATSFELVPLSMKGLSLKVFGDSSTFMQQATIAAIQISAPIMVAIFIMNVFMGVLGRAVPQINVLVTSMPVNIMAGLMIMILTVPTLTHESEGLMQTMAANIFKMLKAF